MTAAQDRVHPAEGEQAPDLSIVIVTWNVRDMALACLRSVQLRSGALRTQVIVVDNASDDGTVDAIRTQHPEVDLVASDANLGFPLGNNRGLEQATGRHILFLNPDTEVGEGAIERCVAELDGNPEVGVVGPRLEYPDGRIQYECGRRDYRLRHLLLEAFYLHTLLPRSGWANHQLIGDWDHRSQRDVEAVSGAFLMARSEVVTAQGGLPSEVFMYHEDLAFCLRALKAGWRIRCLGDVVTIHHGGQSAERSPSRLELFEGEVRVRLIAERGLVSRLLARPFFGVRSLVRSGIALFLRFPGFGSVRIRYPQVADLGKHLRLLLWTVAPGWVLRDLPRAPQQLEGS